MRRLILGTAGHIDHGKTALVQALTGTDTDRLPDEKRRGITIDLGFAALDAGPDTAFGIIDVPGHEGFVRNMLAGATGVDLGLLVVAADEGVMPQTREHLAILDLLGIPAMVVAITKTDLVEPEWLDLVAEDVREALAGTAFANAPTVGVSARSRRGLEELVATLAEAAETAGGRPVDDCFRLPIDRSFIVRGTGTVVTGTVWSGTVTRDEALRILPGDRTVRVRGIQSHGRSRDELVAGERAALALSGVDLADAPRGATLVREPGWHEAGLVTARLRMLPDAQPLRTRRRVRFHLGTAEILGRAVVLEGTTIEPGDEGWVQLRLESPAVARAGDRFVLRDYSPVHTIGGGRIVEPAAPRRKRLTRDRAALLADLIGPDPDQALDAAVRIADVSGLPVDQLPIRATATSPAAAAWLQRNDAIRAGSLVVHPAALDRVRSTLRDAVAQHHRTEPLLPGLDLPLLRQAAPRGTAPSIIDLAVRSLAADGEVEIVGSTIRLTTHQPTPTPAQTAGIEQLAAAIRHAGLAAPSPSELPDGLGSHPDLRRFLGWLEREGRVVGIPGDRWLATEHLSAAIPRVQRELGGRNDLTASEFRDVLPVTRKYLIPLLEHLDRMGVTQRIADLRAVPEVRTQGK